MRADQLNVFTARFNPIRWAAPHRHALDWATAILDSGAQLTIAEVQYGKALFQYADIPHVRHVGLRSDSWGWCKENAIMEAIRRTPEAEFIAWQDADVFHHVSGWAREVVDHLQHYHVVQTWQQCLDMGPGNRSVTATHRSFADCYRQGLPLAGGQKFWKFDGGYHDYPHSGFSWACKRALLDHVGGLFEFGGMGSGDHHMALGMVGMAASSLPGGVSASYRRHVMQWGDRATRFVNGRLGAVPGVIEHRFHGAKANRGYLSRWSMFERHAFDPDTDLKRNSWGVLEFAGNKPELEREWDLYLRSRREDDNCT